MVKRLVLLLCLLPLLATARTGLTTHWVCSAYDNDNKQFSKGAKYRRQALNQVMDQCRSQSQSPASCRVAKGWCEYKNPSFSAFKYWRCTAFDAAGGYWRGDFFQSQVQAIEAAAFTCKHFSVLPATCQVRLMTCVNLKQV